MSANDANNQNRKYESFKIPDHRTKQTAGAGESCPKPSEQSGLSPSDQLFYEIEYDPGLIPGVGRFVMKSAPQKIREPAADETADKIRERFQQMRNIAREHRSSYDFSRFFDRRIRNDNAAIFYQQALFMKDFTDDFTENTPFSGYYPCYQMMGYEQLRTYFTWRTQVRQGYVAAASPSYAFLYIYELLGNIGVENPRDGLDKLLLFWKAFGEHSKAADKYIIRWIKDYYIYYAIPGSFKEFVNENGLTGYYPDLSEDDGDFGLFCAISKYNIRKSVFFTDETKEMISGCFTFVTDTIRRDFEAAGMDFDTSLFRPTRKLTLWQPFKDALFYSPEQYPDRQIVLSQNEIYMCQNGQWRFSTVITTEKGRQFIGYVMKKTESVLRGIKKYRFKLTASLDMINEDTIRVLTNAGLFIEKIIPAAVMEYYREATKTVVTVDPAMLDKIRVEALATQESLIVEEQSGDTPLIPARDNEIFADRSPGAEPEAADSDDPWTSLRCALTEQETEALAGLLSGDELRGFARTCGIMPEVLADGINEKAMDYIGDNLMDDDFELYDDYKNQVKELVK